MSDRISTTPPVTPRANNHEVSPPTSTEQSDSRLTTTSATESDAYVPTLTTQATPNLPFDVTADQYNSDSAAFPHTAPHARDQAANENLSVEPTGPQSNLTLPSSMGEIVNNAVSLDDFVTVSNDASVVDFIKLINEHNELTKIYEQASQSLTAANDQLDQQLGEIFGPQYHLSNAVMQARQRAQQGDAESQFMLGVYYENGSGVKQNYTEAETLYRQASKQGHAGAMRQLGTMYEYGYGVKKDIEYAVTWYQQAAKKGDAHAQIKFGLMLMNGHGVIKDEAMAVRWYQMAAEKGHSTAQRELAAAYHGALGVNKDDYRATYWLLKSSFTDGVAKLDLTGFIGLLDFIPSVLKDFSEFKNLTTIWIQSFLMETDDFLEITKLIRANTPLQALNFNQCLISDFLEKLLIEALENNTFLTLMHINHLCINESFFAKLNTVLAQNTAIAELRKYVKEFFLKKSNFLPIEVLEMVIDRTIVSYIKSGYTKEATVKAIDELLLASRI